MEALLITRNINNRKTYGYDILYQRLAYKKERKDKYSPQVSSQIELSDNPHETETSQIMHRRN